jgi:carboxyl-terminal processing protease
MNRTTKIVALILGAILLSLTTFVGGFAVSQIVFIADNTRAAQNAQLTTELSEMFNLMQREALDPPSETTATIGALNGLLRSNDDHYARFLPEEELQRYEESMAGAFGGIGVLLSEDEGTTFVAQVYEDTPAERAGIQEGDFFYGVDGETRNDWTTSELSSRVRGEVGTDVELTMVRPWDEEVMPTSMEHHLGEPFTIQVTRDIIQAPVTEVKTFDDNVGCVRLFDFNLRAADELYTDIEGLIAEGAESLILDLRSNPGGDLNQAIAVASLFIESGPIVQIEEAGRTEPIILSVRGQQISRQLPLVVLVNGNSASASEIVAAAVQDHERGTVVGVDTFGKGSVQTQIPFRSGAAFMTTAQYLSAHGRVIEEIGVAPDYEVEMSLADGADEETDLQLHAAIDQAKAKQR